MEERTEKLEEEVDALISACTSTLREGRTKVGLLESELSSLHFKVMQQNMLTYNMVLQDIDSLEQQLSQNSMEERNRLVFLESQIG